MEHDNEIEEDIDLDGPEHLAENIANGNWSYVAKKLKYAHPSLILELALLLSKEDIARLSRIL